MGAFFVYILKSTFCLILFYLFYRLFLTRETFHRINRVGILAMILLSVIIPFVKFSVETPVVPQQSLLDPEYLLMIASMLGEEAVVETPLWIRLMLWAYLTGGVLFFILFLYSCYSLVKMMKKGRTIKKLENGITLIITEKDIPPFSWMKWIIISEKDLAEGGEEIIVHEMAHIEARHSLDLLITEICILFHWFNPAMWLFKQELQNIHEYDADEKVLQKGIDAKRYQLLLIKKAVGSQRFTSMANSFNHRSLKKRISMMLKRKSSPWARLKYLMILPLATLAVATFARPEISNELEKISSVKISEIVPIKETIVEKNVPVDPVSKSDTLTSVNQGKDITLSIDGEKISLDESLNTLITEKHSEIEQAIKERQPAMEQRMKEKQAELEKIIKSGMDEEIEKKQDEMEQIMAESHLEIEKIIQEKQGEIEKIIEEHQPELAKIIREKQAENARIMEENRPEIERMINESRAEIERVMAEYQPEIEKLIAEKRTEIERGMMENLSAVEMEIRAEQVEKEIDKYMESYDARMQNRLKEIEQNLENQLEGRLKNINIVGYPETSSFAGYLEDNKLDKPFFISLNSLEPKPMLIVDGEEKDYSMLDKITPSTIQSVSILKNDYATRAYGDKAKAGVILITTKRSL